MRKGEMARRAQRLKAERSRHEVMRWYLDVIEAHPELRSRQVQRFISDVIELRRLYVNCEKNFRKSKLNRGYSLVEKPGRTVKIYDSIGRGKRGPTKRIARWKRVDSRVLRHALKVIDTHFPKNVLVSTVWALAEFIDRLIVCGIDVYEVVEREPVRGLEAGRLLGEYGVLEDE